MPVRRSVTQLSHDAIVLKKRQRGIALIVSMVMLVVITLIGVAVMGGSRLEWLMVNNSLFQTDTNIRVESALREGEAAARLFDPIAVASWGIADQFFFNPTAGSPPTGETLLPDPTNPMNWTGAITAADATTVAPGGTVNKYVVEYMGECGVGVTAGGCNTPCAGALPCIYTYRIWAYSSDNTNKGATRIAQSTFIRTDTGTTTTYDRVGYAEIQ